MGIMIYRKYIGINETKRKQARDKSSYVQKLQSHSTLVVKLTSSSIDLKILRDGALLT